ncbi:unnamed protein product, partial [Brassica rapa subsp. narinosa]
TCDWKGGGSNLSDKGLNLSGSWQQGHSATYNTPSKGSIGHAFTVRIRTENQNQTSFYPFVPHKISVLVGLILGQLRYLLTDMPPQPNSPCTVIVTPAVYPRLVECLHFDIQSTEHKSHCVSIHRDHRNALFTLNSWMFDTRGKIPKELFPVRPPADTRQSALATLEAQAARQQSTVLELGPPSPAPRANPFPKVTDPFFRLPLPTLFHRPEAVHLGDLMRL